MTGYRSEFLRMMEARGCIHQCTDAEALDALLADARRPVPVYIGFDCTADSLHVGSLLQIMTLRRLQQCGHQPIVLIGGGTTRVGDPSGKDESRQLLDDAAILHNQHGIRRVFQRFLAFGEGRRDALMVDNAGWLLKLGYVEVLREIGRHFTLNRMLTFESVKRRLEREQPLSFLEFNYMILQAYDFVELNRLYGCRLQIGGSDQWGNIVSGIELHRRLEALHDHHGVHADTPLNTQDGLYGLTTPLLTTAGGAKMGKTADGAVWLDETKLSPYDYWQYWRNTEDADVGRFLKFFTELPLEEITRLEALEGAEINEAKKILATEATALCHGMEAAEEAARSAAQTFEQKGVGGALPQVEIRRAEMVEGLPAYALLVRAGLCASNGEARRLIRGGGARLNSAPITDENRVITVGDHGPDGEIILSAGKKKHVRIIPMGGGDWRESAA